MDFRRTACLVSAAIMWQPASAQDSAACTLPGELVVEDATGDHTVAATGEGFADIQTLHIAQPGAGDSLVFTYKMADLAATPPNTLWVLRFMLDVPPASGDTEYFVAMLTGPEGSVHFVHGTAGPADGPGGAAPLLFTPAGELDPASGFAADGTITLVVPRASITGLEPGADIFGMIPLTHRITPTDGSEPFAYGFRSVGDNRLAYDEAPDGFYTVLASGACGGGKSALVGAGSLAGWMLGLLTFIGLSRRLARR